MTITAAEEQAMRRALELAASPGVPHGPNPRVGCVLLDQLGNEIAEGFHRGAGTPHAEVAALTEVGAAARGATAVVTLEPCQHTGRTPPCVEALIKAGVARVVFAQHDPNPIAAGGGNALQNAGIDVESGVLEGESRELNRAWTFAHEHQRPFVTWKFATTLDGRSAAADGSSRWITNSAARRDVHRIRGECDAIVVGTETVLRDDPELTVRDDIGEALPPARQPLRVAVGNRPLPENLRINNDAAETVQLRTHDPREVVEELHRRGRQHLLLEGGATLAAAFLSAGLVDEVVAFIAPKILGSGRNSVVGGGRTSIDDALDIEVDDVTTFGDNIRVLGRPRKSAQEDC